MRFGRVWRATLLLRPQPWRARRWLVVDLVGAWARLRPPNEMLTCQASCLRASAGGRKRTASSAIDEPKLAPSVDFRIGGRLEWRAPFPIRIGIRIGIGTRTRIRMRDRYGNGAACVPVRAQLRAKNAHLPSATEASRIVEPIKVRPLTSFGALLFVCRRLRNPTRLECKLRPSDERALGRRLSAAGPTLATVQS